MNKFKIGLLATAVAGALVAQTALADTIELNNWWGGHGSVNATVKAGAVNYNDGSVLTSNLNVSGGAGGFKTYDLTSDPNRQNSFQSWCVDVFHDFSFAISSTAAKQSTFDFFDTNLSAAAAARISSDLGKLATNHLAAADDMTGSPTATQNEDAVAFQLAVWEIVNENSGTYGLSTGKFVVGSANPSDAYSPDVLGKADLWLGELAGTTSSLYTGEIWGVSNGATGWGQQDVLVFTPVPEPEIYAMLGLGLGLMGFLARRRKQNAAA